MTRRGGERGWDVEEVWLSMRYTKAQGRVHGED